ncbi:MAG: hypothetical protein FJ241_09005 [Nitrospira sp.]|nr:hypothetical protein [Nitrospira sp.]
MACRTKHYQKLGNLLTGAPRGEKNPRWKGGVCLSENGRYRLILSLEHPFADRHGYIREHRLVMEKHLGRYLTRQEVVHHLNGDSLDNRIENLSLCSSPAEHMSKFHRVCGNTSFVSALKH